MDDSLKNITILIRKKEFSKAKESLDNLSEDKKNDFNYYFLKGITDLYLSNFNSAIKSFSLAINLKNDNPTFYFYRGYTFSRLNQFNKTKEDYKKAIILKPRAPEFYNNLAGIYYTTGDNTKAIENYLKAIELDKNLKPAFTGLLNVLSQTTDIKRNDSKIIYAHNELNKINLNYTSENYIEDFEIKKIIEQANIIVENNLENLDFDKVQTYREQKLQPHCNRHLKIFKTKNIIPEHCFGCYKIQIEVENVLELIKLYIVFDKIQLKRDNSRKCMIELRPLVNGNYKGLIFCNSIREAEEILKEINVILIKNFNKNLKCKIKRGCSEYYFKFPSYNKLDNTAMSYNSNWKNYEIEFDEKNPDMIFDKISNPTISGISLFDALVFRNWLSYAKMIGDESYKKISNQIFYSKFVEKKLELKLKAIN
tara:strand:+ start:2695 stop:3966 length:1272 start_codon:yes stop_codon:yes gene_type:complete